ncbi:MAG TPA: type II 3-dehydroquinate dehydratase [Solirubrobacterales bacterium]|nr:type II 3-dehydroquinate dehydratase [Solirubrobacterales bacterium]
MSRAQNRVAILHGVNFDVLERRDPDLYGGVSLSELEYRIAGWCGEIGLEPSFFQTNSEAEFCGYLHRVGEGADAAIINAGAWTHYSRAIGDAFAVDPVPAIEVHLSDVDAREEWRRISVFEGLVIGKVAGKGIDGYKDALDMIAAELGIADA